MLFSTEKQSQVADKIVKNSKLGQEFNDKQKK